MKTGYICILDGARRRSPLYLETEHYENLAHTYAYGPLRRSFPVASHVLTVDRYSMPSGLFPLPACLPAGHDKG
jgi:hypothetical protein